MYSNSFLINKKISCKLIQVTIQQIPNAGNNHVAKWGQQHCNLQQEHEQSCTGIYTMLCNMAKKSFIVGHNRQETLLLLNVSEINILIFRSYNNT